MTLADFIYDKLHEDIIAGHLKPGQKLHIAELAKQYHVALSPIREALARLSESELVIAKSQRGFTVSPLSQRDLLDLYKTRAYIEAIALNLSIENGNDDWEAEILAAFHRLAKFEEKLTLASVEHYNEWEKRHRAFNLALIKACGLRHLLDIQNKLYHLTERYRRKWLLAGLQHTSGLHYAKEQKKIMEAALNRNAEQATQLLHQHYEKALQVIEAYFIAENLFNAASH